MPPQCAPESEQSREGASRFPNTYSDITLDQLLGVPEAVAALDDASDFALTLDGAHEGISEAVTSFHMARAGVEERRARVVQYAETGVHEGPLTQHVDELLAIFDKSLALAVEDAVAKGAEQWEHETSGGGDA